MLLFQTVRMKCFLAVSFYCRYVLPWKTNGKYKILPKSDMILTNWWIRLSISQRSAYLEGYFQHHLNSLHQGKKKFIFCQLKQKFLWENHFASETHSTFEYHIIQGCSESNYVLAERTRNYDYQNIIIFNDWSRMARQIFNIQRNVGKKKKKKKDERLFNFCFWKFCYLWDVLAIETKENI